MHIHTPAMAIIIEKDFYHKISNIISAIVPRFVPMHCYGGTFPTCRSRMKIYVLIALLYLCIVSLTKKLMFSVDFLVIFRTRGKLGRLRDVVFEIEHV